ncbi:hypothetical protein CHS0354_012678 [Potamilus streckersoni]|uniref:Alpha-amylase n=1 Tax=Potamilus streckersoni TaxID=2493646 RepID=A0AAE0SXS2_9BIVA|nr:hypothetical protein CHS0354_012678 [Potamilus streckersoni]
MAQLGSSGTGTAGSRFDADNFEFPGVPYYNDSFTPRSKCSSANGDIGNNYADVNVIRNCFLISLTDLDQSQENVRNKIAEYLNHLIDIGVAGFRIDAAKYIWPQDIAAIQDKVKNLPEGGRPFFYHEVTDLNDDPVKTTEYIPLGYVTEFRYCEKIAWGILNFSELDNVVDYNWHMTNSSNALVFVDNHDTQRMPNNVNNLITYKTPREYQMATAFTLANDYGFMRVMSGYDFDHDSNIGPPHNNDFTTKSVTIFSNGSCGDGWICEHRWKVITNMVAFRNAVQGTEKEHWRNVNDDVSFARGNVGFFAMAKDGFMNETLDTGLPKGDYCDLITDCSRTITVDESGMANIFIDSFENPILAFIVGNQNSSVGEGDSNNTTPNYEIALSSSTSEVTSFSTAKTYATARTTTYPTTTASPWKRTVVFLEKGTHNGENVFFAGGLHHTSLNSCPSVVSNNPCAVPIRHASYNNVESFREWSVNDNYLDWYGAEPSQGKYGGTVAKGTPGLWTTNQRNHASYNDLNT